MLKGKLLDSKFYFVRSYCCLQYISERSRRTAQEPKIYLFNGRVPVKARIAALLSHNTIPPKRIYWNRRVKENQSHFSPILWCVGRNAFLDMELHYFCFRNGAGSTGS